MHAFEGRVDGTLGSLYVGLGGELAPNLDATHPRPPAVLASVPARPSPYAHQT
jgi:hypothetical protein